MDEEVKYVEIIRPGTEVGLLVPGDRPVRAMVAAATISKTKVIYNVSYWRDGVRQETWVEAFEILSPKKTDNVRIGFK